MKITAAFCFLLGITAFQAGAAEFGPASRPVEKDGAYTLAQAPKVEGVFLLQQGDWPDDVIKAFHQTEFLDGASIRLRWADFELKDQEFNWALIDKVLNEVRKYNSAHPGAYRTMQIRVIAGVHSPKWFDDGSVRMYDTARINPATKKSNPLHVPMPYDNPGLLKQQHELYQAFYARYANEPLIVMVHGTWSGGAWGEIFHPKDEAPLPPDYTPEKYFQGMYQQMDALIDEMCMKGKVGEFAFSGDIPKPLNLQQKLGEYIVKRMGRRSPFLYVQSNGWGGIKEWIPKPNVGKEVFDLNYGYQALGNNSNPKAFLAQGDWIPLVQAAEDNQVPYVEIYPEDIMPVDTAHNMVQAFTQTREEAASGKSGSFKNFIGYRPWLKQRNFVMYWREAKVTKKFAAQEGSRLDSIDLQANTPEGTSVTCRARTQTGGAWSQWIPAAEAKNLPAGDELEIEAVLHTDDGWRTPVLKRLEPMGETWKQTSE